MPGSSSTPIREFVSRYKLPLLTILAVIGVLFAYHATKREKPFPNWSDDKAGSASTTSQPVSAAGQLASHHLFDTDQGDADPADKQVAVLSSEELHKLTFDMDCLVDLARAHDQLISDYNNLYDHLTVPLIKDALYLRIKNQQPFKRSNLSIEWQQFADRGRLVDTIDGLTSLYVNNRVERMRSAIIGARYTSGDIKFVSFATSHYIDDFSSAGAWVKKASQLQKWLIEDEIITPGSVLVTTIDQYNDVSELVQLIRMRNTPGPSQAPKAVVALSSSNSNSPSGLIAKLSTQEHEDLLLSFDRESREILGNSVIPSQALRRQSPTPEMNLWDFMTNANRELPTGQVIDVPPLKHRKMDYLLRKAMFRDIGGDLGRLLPEDSLDDAGTILEAYKAAMQLHAAHQDTEFSAFADLVAAIGTPDLPQRPLNVGEVGTIKATADWLDRTLQNYADAEAKMNRLLELLRKAKDPVLHRLVFRYKFYEGTVDPFSSSPMRIIDAREDSGPLLPDTAFPRLKLDD